MFVLSCSPTCDAPVQYAVEAHSETTVRVSEPTASTATDPEPLQKQNRIKGAAAAGGGIARFNSAFASFSDSPWWIRWAEDSGRAMWQRYGIQCKQNAILRVKET